MRFKYKSFRRFMACGVCTPETDAAGLLDLIRKHEIDFQSSNDDEEEEDDGGDDDDRSGDDDDDAGNVMDMKLLEAALEHVKAAKVQRIKHIAAKDAAIESKVRWQMATGLSWTAPLPPPVRNSVFRHLLKLAFTADYCMNLALPYLGAEQVGDAYYYSPLVVNCFGIADQTLPSDHLDAFIYMDHDGGKGGNQVVSMIHKFLKMKGLLNKDDPIGELTFSFDNCAGQNKNRMVLGFFAWLVEEGYVLKANVLFLVRGHTKNTCDRLFNILKKHYRRQNVYATTQLFEALNKHEDVDAHWMPPTEFFDWKTAVDLCFNMPDGEIFKNHNFTFVKAKPVVMTISKYDGAEEKEHKIAKRAKKPATREENLRSLPPKKVVDKPIMADIRRNECWKKWRPFIPLQFRTDWWFTEAPSPELIARVKAAQRQGKAKRKAAKISQGGPR